MSYIACKDCRYSEKEWIGDTRSEFRYGDDYRYYCRYYGEVVNEDDTCDHAE